MADEQLYFSIKTKNAETVEKILNREDNIEFDGINVLEDLLVPGRIIFIVLGGDKPAWETGLIGLGILTKGPYDKGYAGKNFKVQVSIKLLMQHPIKREDLVPYRDTYGTIGIAPITKWEPNQALSQISEEKAIALFRAMLEIDKTIEADLNGLIGSEGIKTVKGPTTMMVEVPTRYGESKKEAVEKFILNIDKEDSNPEELNKKLFTYWMSMQVKPEGDSDAGKPYTQDSIKTYSSFIASTKLYNSDNSLFYTLDATDIQLTLESLEGKEEVTSRQKSAVKKYHEFAVNYQNSYEDVINHNLYGIHMKAANDALTEDNPHICIGWSKLGDISNVSSKEELEIKFENVYPGAKPNSKGQQVGQIWRFLHDVQVGDYIIFAESNVFHIGKVESDYYYDDSTRSTQDSDYKSSRKVRWIKKNISRSVISNEFHKSLMTAMSIFSINDYKSAVVDLIRGTYVKDDNEEMEEEFMELVFNTSLESDFDRNRIIFGAPGTGKSFTLNEQAKGFIDATDGKVERVTFHPDYTYSQFVGAYKPTMDGKDIRYEFVPGPFMRVYVEALKSGRTDDPQPFLLIVEEINRAKVAGVFGDIFQLLDRDDDGVSVYEIQASEDIKKYLAEKLGGQPSDYTNIRIPNNMFIWATMNSADQGVFPMDTAFKRRWSFEYLGIDAGEDKLPVGGKFTIAGTEIEWNKLRKGINAKMTSPDFHINEDKLMGPFFLSGKLLKSDDDGNIINRQKFIDVFKSKVLMYLYEDAIKQRKHDFFHNCDTSKYSSVCDAFDEHGVEIFGSNFMSDYYNK